MKLRITMLVGTLCFLSMVTGCGKGAQRPDLSQQGPSGMSHNSLAYSSGIQTLFQNRCALCHGVGSPNGNWLDYETVLAKKKEILDHVFVKKDMPLNNITAITDDERQQIASWIDSGAPKDPVQPSSSK